MEKLLSILKTTSEFSALLESVYHNESAAVTGIGQVNRSHLIAALHKEISRPLVIICQDDIAAKRMQEELRCFLGEIPPILPSRELTLYDASVVSRVWEQKRLRQLSDLASGKTPIQIFTWESLSQRTMPPATLLHAAFRLEIGKEYPIDDLLCRLTASGYTRCAMVEGPGQFAVRGGILDIYSPAADRPVRAEFFGDELDTMGYFDPDTQRRTDNIEKLVILPVGETQPRLHGSGIEGLCADINRLIARQKRRKNINEALISTLEKDLENTKTACKIPRRIDIWP